MKQGDVVLVRFPFTNLVDYKIRPALIVSKSSFNKRFDPWICPITTKKQSNSTSLKQKLVEGNLDRESYVKTNVIASVKHVLILKKIGAVERAKLSEIILTLVENMSAE